MRGRGAHSRLHACPHVPAEWFDTDGPDGAYDFLAYMSRVHVPNQGGTAADLFYSFDTGLMHVVMVAGWVREGGDGGCGGVRAVVQL